MASLRSSNIALEKSWKYMKMQHAHKSTIYSEDIHWSSPIKSSINWGFPSHDKGLVGQPTQVPQGKDLRVGVLRRRGWKINYVHLFSTGLTWFDGNIWELLMMISWIVGWFDDENRWFDMVWHALMMIGLMDGFATASSIIFFFWWMVWAGLSLSSLLQTVQQAAAISYSSYIDTQVPGFLSCQIAINHQQVVFQCPLISRSGIQW